MALSLVEISTIAHLNYTHSIAQRFHSILAGAFQLAATKFMRPSSARRTTRPGCCPPPRDPPRQTDPFRTDEALGHIDHYARHGQYRHLVSATILQCHRRKRLLRDRSIPPGTQAAFTQIARAIVGRSSASEVAQVVVEEVRRLVPSDRSTVWLWQPERDAMQLLAVAAGPNIGAGPAKHSRWTASLGPSWRKGAPSARRT